MASREPLYKAGFTPQGGGDCARTTKPEVTGSNPVGRADHVAEFARKGWENTRNDPIGGGP